MFSRYSVRGESQSQDIFHAVIRPHQALSDAAFEAWVLGFITFALVSSVVANSFGAGLIGIFFGLDGLLIAAMFVAWRASQDRREEILIENSSVIVRRFRRERLVEQRRFPVEHITVARRDDRDYGCLCLQLGRNDKRYLVACDLSPHERSAFADAFCRALVEKGCPPQVTSHAHHPLAA